MAPSNCPPTYCHRCWFTDLPLYKKWSFPLEFLQQICPNPEFPTDLVTFIEEIFIDKLYFLCIVQINVHPRFWILICTPTFTFLAMVCEIRCGAKNWTKLHLQLAFYANDCYLGNLFNIIWYMHEIIRFNYPWLDFQFVFILLSAKLLK